MMAAAVRMCMSPSSTGALCLGHVKWRHELGYWRSACTRCGATGRAACGEDAALDAETAQRKTEYRDRTDTTNDRTDMTTNTDHHKQHDMDQLRNHIEDTKLTISRAIAVAKDLPRSREAALVLTKLDEAQLWLGRVPEEVG